MRITTEQCELIRGVVAELAGDDALITLFGSRADDNKRGGDVDLLVELPSVVENPAWLAARLSAKISRAMAGRKTDIVLAAPNLKHLARVIHRESQHLRETSERLFNQPFTQEIAATLARDSLLSERVEAFVARFSRLQDNLGDKMIPQLLQALGEKPTTVIDNLDKAEYLGWITSADEWQAMRKLRNQMVHDYIEDLAILTSAIQTAQAFIPTLLAASQRLLDELRNRGYIK